MATLVRNAPESVTRREPAVPPAASSTTPSVGGWTLARLVGVSIAVLGGSLGATSLHDNSLFTHLATGRLLVDRGLGSLWGGLGDPYTRFGAGQNWIVQSWLPSYCYGLIDAAAGAAGLRVLMALTTAALAALLWRLSEPAQTLVPRVGVVGLALVVGATSWSQRPLLIGLVLLAVVLLAGDAAIDPRWLVPVMWLWVNSHGSFPFALVALGTLAVGTFLDGRKPAAELRALGWCAGGTLLGGVANPVGPALLLFPLRLLQRSESLQRIVEWRSPTFDDTWTRAFLVLVLVALVGFVRHPSYRVAVPTIVFVAAALVAQRNIAVAVVVLVPAACRGLADAGSFVGGVAAPIWRLGSVAMLLCGTLVVGSTIRTDPGYRLDGYPVAAVDWLDARGLLASTHVLAHPDFVGNYLELRYGTGVPVFIDDRYELHDPVLARQSGDLVRGLPSWAATLETRGVEIVLWPNDGPLASLLEASSANWNIAYRDTHWLVACRPTAGC
jgi:hypothetical protein